MAGMNSDTNHFSEWDSTALAVLVCSILALYNAVELELLVFTTFRRYRGLYFWSLVLASFGILPYVLGFFVEYFRWSYMTVGTSVVNVGWCLMVTGQSVVRKSPCGANCVLLRLRGQSSSSGSLCSRHRVTSLAWLTLCPLHSLQSPVDRLRE